MTRTERINLRVTASEKARLEAAAVAVGKTLTAYILDEIGSPEQRFVMGQYVQEIAEAYSPREMIRIIERAGRDGDITSNNLAILTQLSQSLSNKFLGR